MFRISLETSFIKDVETHLKNVMDYQMLSL